MEKEPKYILEEEELIVGESPGWTRTFFKAFPAFKHKNYQLFFTGQLTSLVGTWMQIVALGWLVLELTNSAFWVAFIQGLDLLPVFLISLPAGMLADRIEKKRIILITQIIAMLIAFLFAALTQFQMINLVLIFALTLLSGIIHGLEMPARQSFIFEVVGKKDLSSAIALNTATFNSARVIGPSIAGILIAIFNVPIAFFLNGVSFLAVIIALFKIKVKKITINASGDNPISLLKEGVIFSFANPVIRTLLFIVTFNAIVPWSTNSLMPVIAKQIFHVQSEGFGLLLSATGLGALAGAIFVSSMSHRFTVHNILVIMSFLAGLSLFLFALIQNFFIGLVLLFFIGFSLVTQTSLANSTIQKATPDDMRGRVMGVYGIMFLGMIPLGSMAMGTLAGLFGLATTLRIIGILTLAGAFLYTFFFKKRLG